jgi:hypothetical protein
MEDVRAIILKLSISTALWNVYKQLPVLLEYDNMLAFSTKVLVKTQLELYKSSTHPVLDTTSVGQMSTLGSGVWLELLTHTMFLCYLLELDNEAIYKWFSKCPDISDKPFGLYLADLTRLLLEQLNDIGIKA